jgi:hypothetical protein
MLLFRQDSISLSAAGSSFFEQLAPILFDIPLPNSAGKLGIILIEQSYFELKPRYITLVSDSLKLGLFRSWNLYSY